jgi:hypothetical protein
MERCAKKVWKKEKKDLTEPALLEMDGNRVSQESVDAVEIQE